MDERSSKQQKKQRAMMNQTKHKVSNFYLKKYVEFVLIL